MPVIDIGREVTLEFIRVTEAAALKASRWMGRGNTEAADQAAVDAMRGMLDLVSIRGTIIIGEGEKDQAPMLYIGEKVGGGGLRDPKVDIAVALPWIRLMAQLLLPRDCQMPSQ
jgi:fructose-1,6-bisphosphatase II